MNELDDFAIKDFLETVGLYSWREFKRPRVNRASLHIREIDSHCEICKQVRPFQDRVVRGSGYGLGGGRALSTGTTELTFKCASCGKAERVFLVEHVISEEAVKLQKYGELPRKPLPRDRNLQKFLANDLENYEKAIVCISHEYGVAAFAYFRRVAENNIGRLLALVREDAMASGAAPEVLEALDELRKDTPMSKRIELAKFALPPYLRPGGANPLAKLYQALSEGIHSLPEADCLAKAKAVDECLSFMVAELTTRQEHRQHFQRTLGKL